MREKPEEFVKNRLILRLQQRLKSKIHNVFNEEVSMIALSANDGKENALNLFDRNMNMEQKKI